MLEEAHRVASRPMGELAIRLETRNLTGSDLRRWAEELRAAAALLDEIREGARR